MSKEFYIMTHYHFVGIKGSGMSSLAQIMHDLLRTTYLQKLLLEIRG